jgi:hypothetical protein
MRTTTMNLVSRLAGEDETDAPTTCCLVLAAAVRQLDARLTQDQRQKLARALVETADPSLEDHRAAAVVAEVVALSETHLPPPPRYPWEKPDRVAKEARELLQEANEAMTSGHFYLAAQNAGKVAAAYPKMVPAVLKVISALAREHPGRRQDG